MKKIIICLSITILGGLTTNAQSFFSFDIGFNIPTAGAALPGFEEVKLADGESTPEITALVGTLNVGPSVHLSFGKWINDNVALGTQFGYLPGITKGDFEQIDISSGLISINTVSGKMMNISPNITLSTSNTASKSLYMRSGLTFGFGFNTKVETETAAVQTTTTQEFVGRNALGFSGALGGRTNLNDKIALFAEAELTTLMHRPKKIEVTTSSPAGTQRVTLDIVKTTGPNSPPTDVRTYTIPFSSIALNVGLMYKL